MQHQATPNDIAQPSALSFDDWPLFLKSGELAQRLGVSTKFLEDSRARGTGPEFVRASRTLVLYPRASVAAWIRARQRTSTSEGAETA